MRLGGLLLFISCLTTCSKAERRQSLAKVSIIASHWDSRDPADVPLLNLKQIQLANHNKAIRLVSDQKSSLWPPWPFNHKAEVVVEKEEEPEYERTNAQVLWAFTRESARATFKNLQVVGSQLWFHLPPAAPPFFLLAALPRKEKLIIGDQATTRWVIPLFANSFARSLALSGVGLALISWGHYEVHRKRKLTPLPLAEAYRDINRAVLPPFLPDAAPAEVVTVEELKVDEPKDTYLPPKLQRHWNSFVQKTQENQESLAATLRDWRRKKETRKREMQNSRRSLVFDELVALQTFKKKRRRRGFFRNKAQQEEPTESVGYALVTGASQGIGRALAVELARYEIPVILVARDEERLTKLAYELESCYGVNTYVLQADLSKPGVAENIYETTKKAGLQVDILVNNAGISSQGLSFDMPLSKINEMIQVNTVSMSTLTHLFGRDMKERRRGRIMIMSSICGSVAGLPSVSVYGATKAFANSLSFGLGKEMEPFGVGVTCIMPGAVTDTAFKSRSKSDQALCWKLPFYLKTPEEVASWSVRATLRGDTEATIGWQNRVFSKVLRPTLPQRLHNIIGEIAWNPLRLPLPRYPQIVRATNETAPVLEETTIKGEKEEDAKDFQPVPRLLQLDNAKVEGFVEPSDNNTTIELDSAVLEDEADDPEIIVEMSDKDDSGSTDLGRVKEVTRSLVPLRQCHLPSIDSHDHHPPLIQTILHDQVIDMREYLLARIEPQQ